MQNASIEKGMHIFDTTKGACITCLVGNHFSDGEIHDVGTGNRNDEYAGFNTPTRNGVF